MAAAAKKITELNSLTVLAPSDLFVAVSDPNGAPETVKITFTDVMGNVRVSSVFNESASFTNGVSMSNGALTVTHNVFARGVISNTVQANTQMNVGNVTISNTVISVGNSTVNTTVHQGYLRFANSTLSQLNSSVITMPTIIAGVELFVANTVDIVNPGASVDGSNGYISVGNNTVNATVNSTSIHFRTSVGNVAIYSGTANARSNVISQVSNSAANGSLYLSTAGKIYLKVANTGSNTDWEKVTTSAAD